MLMLSAEQVEYCQVVRPGKGQNAVLPGVRYQKKLFVKEQSYAKVQRQAVIQQARQAFLEHKAQVLYLLVEDAESLTVWYQDDQVQLADPVVLIDLEQLVSEMRTVGGVKIQDRAYHLSTYPRCFVGSEAVDWLSDRCRLMRADAVRLGQRLVDEKWIHHVTDDHPFKDGYFFYRFYWDEK